MSKSSDPFPLRVLFVLVICYASSICYIVATSDGGMCQYWGRLPPYPAQWYSEHNKQEYVKPLSQTVYLVSGEAVA